MPTRDQIMNRFLLTKVKVVDLGVIWEDFIIEVYMYLYEHFHFSWFKKIGNGKKTFRQTAGQELNAPGSLIQQA